MFASSRRGLTLAFAVLAAAPSVAHAQSQDARRPAPVIKTAPIAPRAGAPVVLEAPSPGRGLMYAWDLDGDGELDDATGQKVTTTLGTGTHPVRVVATDEDGRTGEASQTLQVHATNANPSGRLAFSTNAPRVGQTLTVTAGWNDLDGSVRRVELDADGDGVYESDTAIPVGATPSRDRDVAYATPGRRTVRLRVTDDAGETGVTTATIDVSEQNLTPVAGFTVTPKVPKARTAARVDSAASDPDGQIVKREFDLDGDGSFETQAAADGSASVTFDAEARASWRCA